MPSNSVNLPRTLAIPMCFTENITLECAASTFQVPVGMIGAVRVAMMTSQIAGIAVATRYSTPRARTRLARRVLSSVG